MRKETTSVLTLLSVLLLVCALFGCSGSQSTEATSQSAETTQEQAAETEATEQAADETATQEADAQAAEQESAYLDAWAGRDGYTLKQVVAVSRHNLRAPQDKNLEKLDNSTTHEWIAWTGGGSELTTKGGVAETIMGEFFRKWLEDEGLIPANFRPEGDEVRIYANPRQRTLATAQFFSTGMLPVANVEIETNAEYDKRDPVFMPRFGYVSDSYNEAALAEIESLDGDAGLAGFDADLQPCYDLISEVMDYKNSPAYTGEESDLVTGNAGYSIALGEEPAVSGSIKSANVFSDALTLQYQEAENEEDAAFGTILTPEQWKMIAMPKNLYGDKRYDSKLVAVDCAHLLVDEVASELDRDGRVFTFMCGHDSNQSSLLHALGVMDYELPDTLEIRTPIGGKILFEVWENASGDKFCNIRYVYATTDQIRSLDMLTLENPPASFDLDFEGLERNADGLYALEDVKQMLADTQAMYAQLPVDYPEAQELADAA